MNASERKYQVENAGHESHFFTRKTMSFFGDTMRNYGVCSATIRTNYDADGNYVGKDGIEIEVWEQHGIQDSAYFDKVTFKRVHKAR